MSGRESGKGNGMKKAIKLYHVHAANPYEECKIMYYTHIPVKTI